MEAVMSMNVTPSGDMSTQNLSQIVELIQTLYNSQDPEAQTEANRKLSLLHTSQDAWDVSWLLLDPNQNIASEVQFFAAQMLVLKINESWSQQDEKWLENLLRPKICETLVKYASHPGADRLVMDRLALALANFALHSIPTFWPDAIEEILRTFTPQNLPVSIPPQRICDILMKILTYIPEEYSVHLTQQEHRAKLNSQMTKAGPLVFKFIHTLLAPTNNNNLTIDGRQNVLKCLTSWTLHSRTSLLELEGGKLLLDQLYQLINDDELCQSACSALAASLSDQKSDSYKNTIVEFIPKIANLRRVLDRYKMEEEIECVIKIYSLVINFSENHSRLFLRIVLEEDGEQSPDELKQAIFTIIAIILESTSAPGIYGIDEKYSDISFTFWLSFFENFYYFPNSYNEIVCKTFNPLVDSLLQILITKSQYPPTTTYHQVWNDDQRESFRCYRQDLGDNISQIVQFPWAREKTLKMLHDKLVVELETLLRSEIPPSGERRWQAFETIVYALKAIAESVAFDESIYVTKIFKMLVQVPYSETHALLYCTVAELIAAYSDWLFANPTHLPDAYSILFLGLNSTDTHVRLMSTLSLKDLTAECQSVLQPYASHIIKCCSEAVMRPDSNLATNEKARLMHAIGTSLAVSSNETVANSLNTLTVPLICELATKAQCDPNMDPTARPIILERLTMLNSLIESLYVKHYTGNDYEEGDENDSRVFDLSRYENKNEVDTVQPSLSLLKQLIPIMDAIMTKYRSDEELSDIISNTIKRSSKSLGVDIKPSLKDLLMLMVNIYDPMVNSNILDGSVPLFSLFKSDKELRDLFRDAFAMMSDKTLKVCMGNPLRQLSLTLENYFKFTTQICKKYSSFITDPVTPVNVDYIYKLALASLELPEKRTLVEVCNFLCFLRQKSIGVEHLDRIFASGIDLMLSNIFNIYGGTYSTPRNAIENVSELLFTVIDMDQTKAALKQIIDKDNFPSSCVSREQKAQFVSRICHEKNRRKFKDACSEFVLLARNLSRLT